MLERVDVGSRSLRTTPLLSRRDAMRVLFTVVSIGDAFTLTVSVPRSAWASGWEKIDDADGGIPSFDLGAEQTATLENSLDRDLLARLCQGTPEQPALVECTGGFPVQVRLVVRAGPLELTAVRQLRLRFADEHEPNAQATINGLVAVLDGTERPVTDASDLTLPRQQEPVFRVELAESASETFVGKDGRPEREQLTLSWFVASGDLDIDPGGGFGPGDHGDAAGDDLERRWQPASVEDHPRDTARTFVVQPDSEQESFRQGAELARREVA